ncbi:MAG: hypothetical protein CVU92_02605, partial [Firmicutes bacterium HGW-Firmicutes-17]
MYLQYSIDSHQEKQHFGKIKQVMYWLFGRKRNYSYYGNETHVLTNSGYPDLCDIIYPYKEEQIDNDLLQKILEKYSFIIDLTHDKKIKEETNEK